MSLVFVTEARFIKDANGTVYSEAAFNKELWSRYLVIFSEVYVAGRILTDTSYQGNEKYRCSGDRVKFIELPYFIGFNQYFDKRKQLKQKVKALIEEFKNAKFICRIPGNIGGLVIQELNKQKRPYAVEVVGDPWDVFAPGGVTHFLRPLIRVKTTLDLKSQVKNASAVLYVTKHTLQRRYPSKKASYTTFASDVIIEKADVSETSKSFKKKDVNQIVSIGSLAQLYKSPDVVLKAIKQLYDEGITCFLIWLGGGVFLEPMSRLARELGIAHLVSFKGDVDKEEVKRTLSDSDLFVLASKTEGLPRAMIEAMAAGLPCIGSKVGGIPELLDENVLVPKGDVEKLAAKIKELLINQEFYNQQAERNLEEAKNYVESVLSERRNQFYNYIVNNL